MSGPGAGQALRVIAGDVAEGAGASTSGDVNASQISFPCAFYQRGLNSFENLQYFQLSCCMVTAAKQQSTENYHQLYCKPHISIR